MRWFFFTTLSFLLLVPSFVFAERVRLFESNIRVLEDGTLRVVERIDYDFEELERRGIFRNIPLRFTLGGETKNIAVTDVSVQDLAGTALPFSLDSGGVMLRIRIGNPDATVSGLQTYVVAYTVSGALLFLNEYDELYWNVTGEEWLVPMDIVRAQAILDFPDAHILKATCYAGTRGGTHSCTADLLHEGRLRYEILQEGILARQGVTLAVAFPKGLVMPPSTHAEASVFVRAAGFPLGVLVALWAVVFWYRRGRDSTRRVITREFSPPSGLSPAEAGVVMNDVADMRDIVAQLIELARAGFFTIHQFEKRQTFFTNTEYLLVPQKGSMRVLHRYDQLLLDALFSKARMETVTIGTATARGVVVSSLRSHLPEALQDIRLELYRTVTERGLFQENPSMVRIRWGSAAGVVGALGVVLVAVVPGALSLWNVLGILLAVVTLGAVSFGMPVRTNEGLRIKEHLLGLKQYMLVAEKDRLSFHHAPKRTIEEFDALLPYAIVFGIEKEWAKQFDGVFTEPPAWFAPVSGHVFSASMFASDVRALAAGLASAGAPASAGGAGGGGSVGGGAGGGGGGSW